MNFFPFWKSTFFLVKGYNIETESLVHPILYSSQLITLQTFCTLVIKVCDSNGIRTRNHLVCKRTVKNLAKLTVWLNG